MPRYANPAYGGYPVNPGWAQLGSTLGTALFGDPAARAAQEREAIERDQIQSTIDYNRERTRGERLQNDPRADWNDPEISPVSRLFAGPVTAAAVPQMPGIAMPQIAVPQQAPAAVAASPVASAVAGRPMGADRLNSITANTESGNRNYSNGRPVTSTAGARFAMQVMPATARDPGFGLRPADPNNPDDMNRLGREYRAAMEQRYGGDLPKMWAAYNAGPGRVDAAIAEHGPNWLAAMPAETRNYVATNVRAAGGNSAGGGQGAAPPGPTPIAQAIAGDPTYVEQPGGREIDPQALSDLVRLAVGMGEDPTDALAPLAAMLGTDDVARRSLIAQGVNPSEDFAASSARADNIAIRNDQSKLVQALGLANLDEAGGTLRNDADNRTSYITNEADNQTSRANNADDNATSIRNNNADNATSRANNRDDNVAAGERDRNGGGRSGGTNREISSADVEVLDDELQTMAGGQEAWDALTPRQQQGMRSAAQSYAAAGQTPTMAAARAFDQVTRRPSAPRATSSGNRSSERVVNAPRGNVIRFDAQGNRIQ